MATLTATTPSSARSRGIINGITGKRIYSCRLATLGAPSASTATPSAVLALLALPSCARNIKSPHYLGYTGTARRPRLTICTRSSRFSVVGNLCLTVVINIRKLAKTHATFSPSASLGARSALSIAPRIGKLRTGLHYAGIYYGYCRDYKTSFLRAPSSHASCMGPRKTAATSSAWCPTAVTLGISGLAILSRSTIYSGCTWRPWSPVTTVTRIYLTPCDKVITTTR
ncbi:MAG: hypothetical protein N2110_05555 [Flavobacteriales bacterium]|nr:hypothetical protein [Flavobacteriales bacterium]